MTRALAAALPNAWPAMRRLSALADLRPDDLDEINAAARQARGVPSKRDIIREGAPVTGPMLILEGWAARVRYLVDGRRQIVSLILPGDLVGYCRQPRPRWTTAVAALTPVRLCPAPAADPHTPLGIAYATSSALDEAYLIAAITRNGRLSAEERLADLFLELLERLDCSGLVQGDVYAMPLTQEMLADMLGLTSVHVNRMLQLMRQKGILELKSGRLALHRSSALSSYLHRTPIAVSMNSE